jgi:hypothetical protein
MSISRLRNQLLNLTKTMQTIPISEILGYEPATPVSAVSGIAKYISQYTKDTSAKGPYTRQMVRIAGPDGTSIAVTAWNHRDLTSLKGKNITISCEDGKSLVTKMGRDSRENVNVIELEAKKGAKISDLPGSADQPDQPQQAPRAGSSAPASRPAAGAKSMTAAERDAKARRFLDAYLRTWAVAYEKVEEHVPGLEPDVAARLATSAMIPCEKMGLFVQAEAPAPEAPPAAPAPRQQPAPQRQQVPARQQQAPGPDGAAFDPAQDPDEEFPF